MVLNKDIGWWMNNNDIDYDNINDVAYYFYTQYRKNRQKDNITSQAAVIIHRKTYKRFYDDAHIFIRRQKVNRLLKNKI